MDTRKISPIRRGKDRGENLADRIYNQLKQDIFEFRLLPGDRFSENEIAERVQASRTPVREALFRLQREGYVDVLYRSGWQIRPFDFKSFEDPYDVRLIIEIAAPISADLIAVVNGTRGRPLLLLVRDELCAELHELLLGL